MYRSLIGWRHFSCRMVCLWTEVMPCKYLGVLYIFCPWLDKSSANMMINPNISEIVRWDCSNFTISMNSCFGKHSLQFLTGRDWKCCWLRIGNDMKGLWEDQSSCYINCEALNFSPGLVLQWWQASLSIQQNMLPSFIAGIGTFDTTIETRFTIIAIFHYHQVGMQTWKIDLLANALMWWIQQYLQPFSFPFELFHTSVLEYASSSAAVKDIVLY